METRIKLTVKRRKNIYIGIDYATSRYPKVGQRESCRLAKNLIKAKFEALSYEEKLNLFNLHKKFKRECTHYSTSYGFTYLPAIEKIENEAKEEASEEAEKKGYTNNNFFEGCDWYYLVYTM